MKQLLLITAITCTFATQGFAGSSCKPCPTAPAETKKEQPADADKGANASQDADAVKTLLASNCGSTMTPADETKSDQTKPQAPATQDAAPADGQIQTKFLLAGGSSPSKTEAPVAPADEKKAEDVEADKTAPAQLIA